MFLSVEVKLAKRNDYVSNHSAMQTSIKIFHLLNFIKARERLLIRNISYMIGSKYSIRNTGLIAYLYQT